MLKRNTFLLVVLILAVIAVAIPESRKVMEMQLSYALKARTYPSSSLISLYWPEEIALSEPASNASVLSKYQTYLVLAEVGKDHQEYCYKAIETEPNRPEAYVSAIMVCSTASRYERSEQAESESYSSVDKINTKAAKEIMRLAEAGRRGDPGNALFDLVLADMLFGLHRDADAVEMIHSAANKPHYNHYRKESVQAVTDYARMAGLPDVESRLVGYNSLWRMFLLQHRRVFELGVWKSRELQESGKSREAESLLLDLCRVGESMCMNAVYYKIFAQNYRDTLLITRFLPINTSENFKEKNENTTFKDRVLRTSKVFKTNGWPELASTYERTVWRIVSDYARISKPIESLPYIWWWPELMMLLTLISSIALNFAVVCVAAAGLIWLGLRIAGLRNDCAPGLTRKGQFILLLIILIPWLLFVGLTFPIICDLSDRSYDFAVKVTTFTQWNYPSICTFLIASALAVYWKRNKSRFRSGAPLMAFIWTVWAVGLLAMLSNMVSVEIPDSWIPYYILSMIFCTHAAIMSGTKPWSVTERLPARLARAVRMDMLCLAKALVILYLVLLLLQLPLRPMLSKNLDAISRNEVQWLLSKAK